MLASKSVLPDAIRQGPKLGIPSATMSTKAFMVACRSAKGLSGDNRSCKSISDLLIKSSNFNISRSARVTSNSSAASRARLCALNSAANAASFNMVRRTRSLRSRFFRPAPDGSMPASRASISAISALIAAASSNSSRASSRATVAASSTAGGVMSMFCGDGSSIKRPGVNRSNNRSSTSPPRKACTDSHIRVYSVNPTMSSSMAAKSSCGFGTS